MGRLSCPIFGAAEKGEIVVARHRRDQRRQILFVPPMRDLPRLVFAFEDTSGRLRRDRAAVPDSRIGVIAFKIKRDGPR